MKMRRLAAVGVLLYVVTSNAGTVVLQQGADGYNGVEDTHIVNVMAEEYVGGAGPHNSSEYLHLHRC